MREGAGLFLELLDSVRLLVYDDHHPLRRFGGPLKLEGEQSKGKPPNFLRIVVAAKASSSLSTASTICILPPNVPL